jgi:hypothetical protein
MIVGALSRHWVLASLTAAVALASSGCGSSSTIHRAANGCPITHPGGPRPPRRALLNFGTPMTRPSDPSLYGNGTLWTALPWGAPVVRDPHTGMLGIKVPWFRAHNGLVTITASPLTAPSARFSASVGTPQEYGPTGFAASGLAFGRPGCWRLRASLAGRILTVVVNVPRPGGRRR